MKRKRQFQVWHEFFFRFSCFKFFGCFIFLYYLLRCCVVHLIKFVCSLVYLNFMLIITEAACNVSHIFHITQSFILCVLVQVRQHQHSSLGAWRTTREHQKNFSSVCCNYLLYYTHSYQDNNELRQDFFFHLFCCCSDACQIYLRFKCCVHSKLTNRFIFKFPI